MGEFWSHIDRIFREHPGKAAGALIGFIFGVLLLTIGIVKTLFILLLTILGFLIGNILDTGFSLPRFSSPFKKSGKKRDSFDEEDEEL